MQCIYLIFQFREVCLKIVCYRENIQRCEYGMRAALTKASKTIIENNNDIYNNTRIYFSTLSLIKNSSGDFTNF